MKAPQPRHIQAAALLGLFPRTVQLAAAEDEDFRTRHRISVATTITVGPEVASFERAEFYQAIRKGYAQRGSVATLKDNQGREWQAGIEGSGNGLTFALRGPNQGMLLPDFFYMDSNKQRRLERLAAEAHDCNLPVAALERWRSSLKRRALDDDEAWTLVQDLNATPTRVAKSLIEELQAGHAKLSTLVPEHLSYYERLIGPDDGSLDIDTYAADGLKTHISQLIQWNPIQGARLAMLLALHSAVVWNIDEETVDRIDLMELTEWALQQADPFSRLGVLELAIRRLDRIADLQPKLIDLLKSILSEDSETLGGNLHLLSASFMFVEGELNRTKVLSSWSPYRRRLASLAHAALITQQVVSTIEPQNFAEWAYDERAHRFLSQCFVDLRAEPRWLPQLAEPEQMYHELTGRLVQIAGRYGDELPPGELKELLLGNTSDGLRAKVSFRSFWPGPLEGVPRNLSALPDEIAQLVRNELAEPVLSASAVTALINSHASYAIDPEFLDLTVSSLRSGKLRLDSENLNELNFVLFGLGSLAASARRPDLADQVRRLSRVSRRSGAGHVSPLAEIRAALVAAAAYEEVEAWGSFIGEWAFEISLAELSREDAEQLLMELQEHIRTEPELARFLGRARAALIGFVQM